ncbi:type II toxin-antitoxin system VapC family toxin [Pleurocapsa sp. FMAR1]|uniref:type II toxin-antitoxin system VapC family toxin n=1 Tax=Pleurocapsa sp. FMAR1 TaxID=3040204 RepID=UPI0029C7F21D|nr:type II toxin-antitoxin system VapC family toxin [Pleurocapsa sp. FMAR1]
MIILDTNVLSELMKSQPDLSVVSWIKKHKPTNLFITTLTQAEILYGLEILPIGKRRNDLKAAAISMFELDFSGRILPFDPDAAELFATIAAKRRKIGLPISQIDAQIAAIALSHRATLATRNVRDFEECNLNIVNPWE